MTSRELRQKYLDFFKSKGHTIIPSASLIPENDPSVLFTTAGMHPLVPYLLGEKHPAGNKLTDIQKCVRTGDIDEVGDANHHTFFEMMGNWSLGDYFKKESIQMSWEFLTSPEWLGLDKNRIAVSVFAGDSDSPFDDEAYAIWRDLGISEKRIAKLPKENNWWGMERGPCGPDTEIFYWAGPSTNSTSSRQASSGQAPEEFNDTDNRWVEIWNNVFLQYDKKADGTLDILKQKNVDTGMGLERTLAVLNGFDDNYKTDLFVNTIDKIEKFSGKKYGDSKEITRMMRIIADHVKATTFIMGDDRGIAPSNVGQGYVVRRLIRRAIRYGKQLGIAEEFWIKEVAKIVIHDYHNTYPELQKNIEFIFEELKKEEDKFKKTLEVGLKEFEKLKSITGVGAFNLYQTYGFPLELSIEELQNRGIAVDDKVSKEFAEELTRHQDKSRTASSGMFKGGLADDSFETTKYHTAAHLMLAAIRNILGKDIVQKGANITAERLRFDFNYPEKLTPEQTKQIEDLVNTKIQENIPVEMSEIPKEEALKIAKTSFNPAKYDDIVKVYRIADFSIELCGGPHVQNTGKLGHFKITKEESSSAGVRRIKAILE